MVADKAGSGGPAGGRDTQTAALRYASNGWAVFPVHTVRDGRCSCGDVACSSPAKHPVGFLVPHGFREATTDEHQIRGWFTGSDWNIGIATGQLSGIVVLDVDPRHGSDQSILQLDLPDTVEVQSGGGGRHLYFRCPDTSVGTRSGIAPGLDLCGDGGSIIAPPSRHSSGGIYRWRPGRGPDEMALAPLPESLRGLIDQAGWKRRAAVVGEPIPEGQRNTTLTSYAGSMRRPGMTEAEILAALLVVNTERCTPPLEEEEVRQVAASVSRYESQAAEVGIGVSAAAPKEGAAAAKTDSLFRTAAQIASTTSPDVPWVVRPWVAQGSTTEIDGKIKSAGKTTFVSHMVAAILDGKPFLGEPTLKSPVVWCTEQGDISFREVLRRANLLHREDLVVLSSYRAAGRPWIEVAKLALAKAETIGARLVIVDTLGAFAGLVGDAENRAGDAEAAVRAISESGAAKGIGVILVRHERKSGGDEGEAGRGSSAFGGAVDLIVAIRRIENAPRPTFRLLKTLGRFDETPVELVIELTNAGYVSHGASQDMEENANRDLILEVLPTDPVEALKVEELTDRSGLKRTKVQNILKRLIEESLDVIRIGSGARGDPYRYHRPGTPATAGDSAAAGRPLSAAAKTDQVEGPGQLVGAEREARALGAGRR